jgi:hypothetical protein
MRSANHKPAHNEFNNLNSKLTAAILTPGKTAQKSNIFSEDKN